MESAYVPMHFLRNLVQLVADEESMTPKTVLHKTGLSLSSLMDENAQATFKQSTNVYERVAELSTIPGIGFRSPSAHSFADQGMLGAMMIMAPTVGDAFKKLSEFIDVVGGAVDYKFRHEKNQFIVSTHDKTSYSPAAHKLIAEENIAVWKFSSLPVSGLENHLKEIRLDYPKPRHWRMYTDLFPKCDVRFDQPEIAAVLSPDVVDVPIVTHNPEAFQNLEDMCAKLLARIKPSFKTFVMDYMEQIEPVNWSVEKIANALNLTQKTLRRRLNSEGTSAKELIELRKKNLAMSLIERGFSDAEIAIKLNYADKSSFARSFKAWTDLTPIQYRKNKMG